MKILLTITAIFTSFLWAQEKVDMEELIPDTFITGQFDNDNLTDTVGLWVPRGHDQMFGCSVCKTEIRFSNGIKTIRHYDDVGYRLENVGDLNGDGIEDIAYCPDWYMGCRRTYHIYILKEGGWKDIPGMKFMACGDQRGLKNRIEIMLNHRIKLWGDEPEGTETFRIVELD